MDKLALNIKNNFYKLVYNNFISKTAENYISILNKKFIGCNFPMKIMSPSSCNFSKILLTSLPTLLHHSLCSFSFLLSFSVCLSFKEKNTNKKLTKIKIKTNKQKANNTKICQNERKNTHTNTHTRIHTGGGDTGKGRNTFILYWPTTSGHRSCPGVFDIPSTLRWRKQIFLLTAGIS